MDGTDAYILIFDTIGKDFYFLPKIDLFSSWNVNNSFAKKLTRSYPYGNSDSFTYYTHLFRVVVANPLNSANYMITAFGNGPGAFFFSD